MTENKRTYNSYVWFLVAVGIAVRLAHWWAGRALWLDETYIAENVLSRSFAELLRPLDNNQSAPLLFLWGVKASTLLFGSGEKAFHLFPLLTSVAQLLLLPSLVRRSLPGWGGVAAAFFCAFSVRLIEYAQELKQYGTEAFVVTAIAWFAVRLLEDEISLARRLQFWFGGVVALLLAHTAVFALAAFGLAYLVIKGRKVWSRESLLFLATCGAFWLPVFAVNFLWVIAPNYSDPIMKEFWSFAYLRLPLDAEGLTRWRRLTVKFLDYLGLPFRATLLVSAVATIGLWSGFCRRAFLPLFSLGLISLFVGASMAGRAPLFGRLSLFLAPPIVFALAYGLAGVGESRSRWLRLGSLLACVVLAGFYLHRNRVLLITPSAPASVKPGLEWVRAHVPAGDTVIVSRWTRPAVLTYFTAEERERFNIVAGPTYYQFNWANRRFSTPALRSDVPRILAETDWSRLRNRVWLLVGGDEIEIEQVIGGHLKHLEATVASRHDFERVSVVELRDWRAPSTKK